MSSQKTQKNVKKNITQDAVKDIAPHLDKDNERYIETFQMMEPGKDMSKDLFMKNFDLMWKDICKEYGINARKDSKYKKLKAIYEKQFAIFWLKMVQAIAFKNDERYKALSNPEDPNYEILADPQVFRLTTKPIDPKFQVFWAMYKKQFDCLWRAEEIDYSTDKRDFENELEEGERTFVERILSFFSASDGLVNINLRENFLLQFQVTEVQYAYGFQLAMENVHAEVYSDMLTEIISDVKKRDELINGFKTIPSIKGMTDWAKKWIDAKDVTLGQRLIAFAIVEGVFFSGAFAAIYWLKKNRSKGKHIMNGLFKSNAFIARDEGLHTNFACVLYSFINNRVSKEDVKEMFDEAVELTATFSQDAIRCELIGMSPELMKQYNRYVCDRLLVYLGYEKIYGDENPFQFMETIGFLNKDNFFEVRPDAYQSATNEDNTNTWMPVIDPEFATSDEESSSEEED